MSGAVMLTLLFAMLARADPCEDEDDWDTGYKYVDGYCIVAERTGQCALDWIDGCPTWDDVLAGYYAGAVWPGGLFACEDGSSAAWMLSDRIGLYEYDYVFAAHGGLIGVASWCTEGTCEYCCEGHVVNVLWYGAGATCGWPTPYTPPPKLPELPPGVDAACGGSGCAAAPTAAGWGAVALAVLARRTGRRTATTR